MKWITRSEQRVYPVGGDELCWFAFRQATVVRLKCWCPQRRILIANAWCVGNWEFLGRWEAYGVFMSKFVKKALASAKRQQPGTKCTDANFLDEFPALAEFMTLEFDEGASRQTATLNVFFGLGSFRAFLNDRESQQSLCVTADTFQGVLGAIERALTSDAPGWRPMGPVNGQAKKKR